MFDHCNSESDVQGTVCGRVSVRALFVVGMRNRAIICIYGL